MEFIEPLIVVASRWLHVMSAILAVGGAFFMRVILPAGLAQADAASREAVFLRCRKIFKMLVHTCILLLLLTGAYNTMRNWGDYKLRPGIMHAFWGMHLILGVGVMVLSLMLVGPKAPPKWHKAGAAFNVGLMIFVVLLASCLKYARDTQVKKQVTPVQIRS